MAHFYRDKFANLDALSIHIQQLLLPKAKAPQFVVCKYLFHVIFPQLTVNGSGCLRVFLSGGIAIHRSIDRHSERLQLD